VNDIPLYSVVMTNDHLNILLVTSLILFFFFLLVQLVWSVQSSFILFRLNHNLCSCCLTWSQFNLLLSIVTFLISKFFIFFGQSNYALLISRNSNLFLQTFSIITFLLIKF
jgi:hypothetical protein